MPTVKKKVPRYKKFFVNDVLPGPIIRHLETGQRPGPKDERGFECFLICIDDEKIKAIWDEYKTTILREWVHLYPGTRPFAWWEWDAPRNEILIKEWRYHHRFPIVRKQITGKGMTNQERYPGMLPSFSLGVPDSWDSIEKTNPPVYESQAAYLKRHGLLTKEETRTLTEEDFEPESIYEIMDFGECEE